MKVVDAQKSYNEILHGGSKIVREPCQQEIDQDCRSRPSETLFERRVFTDGNESRSATEQDERETIFDCKHATALATLSCEFVRIFRGLDIVIRLFGTLRVCPSAIRYLCSNLSFVRCEFLWQTY